MDISAILPVNMGNDTSSSLNDDFSAQTASGDNIFSKPLGARTFFRTPTNGLVLASFVFDPKKSYGEDHNIASVTSDWMQDLRQAMITQLLKPEDVVPKTKNLEETVWDQLTSLLPKETLAKNLFSDKETFDNYRTLLTSIVTKSFNEEKILTEKMQTEAFKFSFEIAIDAYPQELGGNNEKKTSGDKTGVLTFHIAGIPDGKMPVKPPKEDKEESDKEDKKSKKRKMDDSSKDGEKKKKKEKATDAQKLIEDLALTAYFKDATVENQKKFPHTATQFFECVNRWFSATVARRAAKLEKDRNRNPLYH